MTKCICFSHYEQSNVGTDTTTVITTKATTTTNPNFYKNQKVNKLPSDSNMNKRRKNENHSNTTITMSLIFNSIICTTQHNDGFPVNTDNQILHYAILAAIPAIVYEKLE